MDEGELTETESTQSGNLAAALFRLEHSRDFGEADRIVESLDEWLDPEKDRDLRRAFRTWVTEVLAEARSPEAVGLDVSSLEESRDMLRERVKEWTREWEQQGLEKGLEQGLRKGERRVLLRQLELKFGKPDAGILRRIEQADGEQLLTWSENLLSADRLEDVFH